ncbi:transcriptional regulator, TetR family [Streptomyces sp. DvalAA-14]|uniref:TetR-like C-terminal domain-containing protein n=1 Tax=unclassified Streptomyces TaxID=2593676 RepID=UPI00081B795A|nr:MULTISPECIES: TetR-like C-terminal domain-containing protein [unclassified Streptomyces]MYS20002.1 TetR family transcriptional regulator [Streptomyces sp. SID4948]SCD58446.1 transcriptional regulator, TetR family [Streptomyces sp. DvalAA-14]
MSDSPPPTPPTPARSDQASDRGRGGRSRDTSRDDALRRAALDLVTEIGYDRMTMDAVAARAAAGKATVYRRWSNKAELVGDALAHQHADGVVPDTGSLRGDLAAFGESLFSGQDPLYKARLITGLASAVLADPELRRTFETLVPPTERAVATIVDRAVARGEIAAPADPALIAAILPALGLHRLIFSGVGPDPDYAAAVIDTVLLPALLASSASPSPATR